MTLATNFDVLTTRPFYLVVLVLLVISMRGLWWAIAVNIDAKRRGIPRKLLWTILTLFTAGYGSVLYTSVTGRPETSISLSALGIFGGDKLEKISKGALVALVFLIFCLLAWNIFTISQSSEGWNNLVLSQGVGGILYRIILPTIMIICLVVAYQYKGKQNPLDKPLWGMEMTEAGAVDITLSKHKKVAYVLIGFILLLALYIGVILFSAQ